MNRKEKPQWECPICAQILSGKIFQCIKGHAFCESCRAKLETETKTCPTCREPLNQKTITRMLYLEDQLDKMLLPCPHTQDGCKIKLKRNLIPFHENSCIFGVDGPVDLCKLLGHPNCEFKLSKRNGNEAVDHLINAHACTVFNDSWYWSLNDFTEITAKQENISTWKCMFQQTETSPPQSILIVCEDMADKHLSWSCIDLSTSASTRTTNVTFSIPNEKSPILTWTSQLVSGYPSSNFLKNPQFKTSIPYLVQLCDKNGDLGMDVQIKIA